VQDVGAPARGACALARSLYPLKTVILATKLHKDTQIPFNKKLLHTHVMGNISDKALFRFRLYPRPYALGPRPAKQEQTNLKYKEKKNAN
jgi:hypothetical protein